MAIKYMLHEIVLNKLLDVSFGEPHKTGERYILYK